MFVPGQWHAANRLLQERPREVSSEARAVVQAVLSSTNVVFGSPTNPFACRTARLCSTRKLLIRELDFQHAVEQVLVQMTQTQMGTWACWMSLQKSCSWKIIRPRKT